MDWERELRAGSTEKKDIRRHNRKEMAVDVRVCDVWKESKRKEVQEGVCIGFFVWDREWDMRDKQQDEA